MEEFPDNAKQFLGIIYNAHNANTDEEKENALIKAFAIGDMYISHEDRLRGLEFYVLVQVGLI